MKSAARELALCFLYSLVFSSVSAAQNQTRYQVSLIRGDSVVVDQRSGLMWADTQYVSVSRWHRALSYCERLVYAGFSDWRLPNIRAMSSVVDFGQSQFSINFPSSPMNRAYWTSSTYEGDKSKAWTVVFDGRIEAFDKSSSTADARCIR